MSKPNITVTLAQNGDGDVVKNLVLHSGQTFEGLDWHDIYPHWLLAQIESKPAGCLQVCVSKPVGRLEILSISPALGHRDRACVVKALVRQGMETLRLGGVGMAVGLIPFEFKGYKKLVKRRGGTVIGSGNLLARRLT